VSSLEPRRRMGLPCHRLSPEARSRGQIQGAHSFACAPPSDHQPTRPPAAVEAPNLASHRFHARSTCSCRRRVGATTEPAPTTIPPLGPPPQRRPDGGVLARKLCQRPRVAAAQETVPSLPSGESAPCFIQICITARPELQLVAQLSNATAGIASALHRLQDEARGGWTSCASPPLREGKKTAFARPRLRIFVLRPPRERVQSPVLPPFSARGRAVRLDVRCRSSAPCRSATSGKSRECRSHAALRPATKRIVIVVAGPYWRAIAPPAALQHMKDAVDHSSIVSRSLPARPWKRVARCAPRRRSARKVPRTSLGSLTAENQ
jgi:hypothetical protein